MQLQNEWIHQILHLNHFSSTLLWVLFPSLSFCLGAAADVCSLSSDSKLIDQADAWIAHSSEFLFPLKQSINHAFFHPERLLINAPSFHFPLLTPVIRKWASLLIKVLQPCVLLLSSMLQWGWRRDGLGGSGRGFFGFGGGNYPLPLSYFSLLTVIAVVWNVVCGAFTRSISHADTEHILLLTHWWPDSSEPLKHKSPAGWGKYTHFDLETIGSLMRHICKTINYKMKRLEAFEWTLTWISSNWNFIPSFKQHELTLMTFTFHHYHHLYSFPTTFVELFQGFSYQDFI